MKARARRGALIAAGLAGLGVATALVLHALNGAIELYVTPTQIVEGQVPHDGLFRLGGLVEKGSLQRQGTDVRFLVTDTARQVSVVYDGILPDLFAPGRGVVVQGRLGPHGTFHATQVLAKHSANYMPPEARNALEQARQTQRTLRP